MNGKKIIWALFDDGERSYYNSLNNRHRVISIGINDKTDSYLKLDLRLNNENLITSLEKLPPPDIILASPPCESWSIADNQRRAISTLDWGDGRLTMNLRTREFYDKNNSSCHPAMRRDFFKQHTTRLNGESTLLATIKIIEHFKPKVWVIENPATSLMWKYMSCMDLMLGSYDAIAYYNSYDEEFTRKPTNFRSNMKLNLKRVNVKQKKKWSETSGYDHRSSIPKDLILDIMEQIENDLCWK